MDNIDNNEESEFVFESGRFAHNKKFGYRDDTYGKKIFLHKLFPKLNNVTLSNLKIDFESVSFITPPIDSKKISDILSKHMTCYKKSKDSVIVDATGGVGGDTIMLSTQFNTVISIELDSVKYSYLKHNIEEYGFKNVTTINGDSSLLVQKIACVDALYMDPPWGGRDYKLKTNIRLTFGNMELETFILNCFDKNMMASCPKIIGIKLPKNYDLKYLYEKISGNHDIYLYPLKKINIVIVEKKVKEITDTNDNKNSPTNSDPQAINVHQTICFEIPSHELSEPVDGSIGSTNGSTIEKLPLLA